MSLNFMMPESLYAPPGNALINSWFYDESVERFADTLFKHKHLDNPQELAHAIKNNIYELYELGYIDGRSSAPKACITMPGGQTTLDALVSGIRKHAEVVTKGKIGNSSDLNRIADYILKQLLAVKQQYPAITVDEAVALTCNLFKEGVENAKLRKSVRLVKKPKSQSFKSQRITLDMYPGFRSQNQQLENEKQESEEGFTFLSDEDDE
jgi:hypothetical protein